MPLTPPTDGYMHLSEPDGSNDAKFASGAQIRQHVEVGGETLQFDGRAYPVGYAGERTSEPWTLAFQVNKDTDGTEQWAALRYLVDNRRGRVLVWRDHIGNVLNVWLLAIDRELLLHPNAIANQLAQVSFTLQRVEAS
jgi:hypothetical protein